MTQRAHDPESVFPPYRAYTHAVEVTASTRTLYISGLNGFERDGTTMPASFEAQADLIWQHLRSILASAGMTVENLVSIRTYLADPADDEANVRARVKHLGTHRVALTVISCRLLEPKWKLEVEAIAAA